MRTLLLIIFGVCAGAFQSQADESWPDALAKMPLGAGGGWLTRTNCAEVLLTAFQSNASVKALIFMPGATDELYFFHRVNAKITNASPTLLDAVIALTNQTPLRVVFKSPFVLIHGTEDMLDVAAATENAATRARLGARSRPGHLLFVDRDWEAVMKVYGRSLGVRLWPSAKSSLSRHFYRHTFAAWNLTAWETIQVTALAGKTRITILRNKVEFDVDTRINELPKLDRFPD